jgi:hypothetical protein
MSLLLSFTTGERRVRRRLLLVAPLETVTSHRGMF